MPVTVIFNIREVNTNIYIHPSTHSKDKGRKFKKEIAVVINDMKHIISPVITEVKTKIIRHLTSLTKLTK